MLQIANCNFRQGRLQFEAHFCAGLAAIAKGLALMGCGCVGGAPVGRYDSGRRQASWWGRRAQLGL